MDVPGLAGMRPLALALLCSNLLFADHGPQPRSMEGGVHRAHSGRNGDDRGRAPAIRRMHRPDRTVRLRALTRAEAAPDSRKPGLQPSGISRGLPQHASATGEWSVSPEGRRVWRMVVESPGAEALRIRFGQFHAGEGAVWIIGNNGQENENTVGPYTGDGLFNDGEFWSDLVVGESVTIAWQPPDHVTGDSVPFEILELSHQFPKRSSTGAEEVRRLATAASCTLDMTCYPEYAEPASAVAYLIFQSGGASYNCSGALISSAAQPAVPYLLTANHCISTAEEARSAISVFNYQTKTCNGSRPPLSGLPRVTGATLVASRPMQDGDSTLLRLTSFPNVDVKVLGWSSGPIAADERVIGISHPRGDFKRFSSGQRTRDVAIRFSDGDRMPADVGYQVTWFEGVTQGGSSGSPLLATINGRQYVVGSLTAGPDVDEDDDAAVCRPRNLIASYGRFSAAWPSFGPFLTSQGELQSLPAGGPASLTITERAGSRVTLAWSATGVASVQVRVGSPVGPPMTGIGPATGSAQTGDWVADGMVFYLQNASSGDSAGAQKTLAAVRAAPPGATFGIGVLNAAPLGPGAIRLSWQAYGATAVQIRVGSPYGPPMSGLEPLAGAVETGAWVSSGMSFYLQDATGGDSAGQGRTLASVTVR